MATIKQFTVTVNNITDKDNPFVVEVINVRAKSKAEAADSVWARLEGELFKLEGIVDRNHVIVKKYYKLNIELTRMLQATGYQTVDKREAARAKARQKAAAKKAAAKKNNPNGKVRVSHI